MVNCDRARNATADTGPFGTTTQSRSPWPRPDRPRSSSSSRKRVSRWNVKGGALSVRLRITTAGSEDGSSGSTSRKVSKGRAAASELVNCLITPFTSS